MLTSPKLIAPLQIARAIATNLPVLNGRTSFTDAILRVLVGSKALERGRAQGPASGPFAEFDRGHEAGLHEDRALRGLAAAERAVVAPERLELAPEQRERAFGEAGADLPRVHQPAVLHDANRECAEMGAAPALARRPAADHDVLEVHVLDLDPARRAPARLVGGVEALGHYPFDAELPGGCEQCAALAAVIGRGAPRRARQLEGLEDLAAILVGQRQRGAAVEVEQVEDDVAHRRVAHAPPDRRVRRQVHARLEPLEAGPPLVVEGDHLAVEYQPPRAQFGPEAADLRIDRGEVGEVAALEVDLPVVAEEHGANTVPLDLEAEIPLVTRQAAAAREHRLDPLRHRLVAGVLRRVHAVDQPVLAARVEERVAAVQPLSMERGDHLVLAELLRLEGTAVPDAHRPGAVLALRDIALELEVLERVVLGADRQAVLVGMGGDAPRERPRGQHALVFQGQVPVQPPRVMLLDHEPAAGGLGRAGASPRP